MDTIFAVSSGRPPAAIAVLRVSGPGAFAAVAAMTGTLPEPRRAGLRGLRDAGGALLDRALIITFPGPATATGEDLVELHCHGGRAVVAAVERALAICPGLRPAEPGEFTRRALMNGRIDLTEAEGLADLLEAETETQRVAALSAAEGRISRAVRDWMDRIAMLSARIEAMLDFSDEDDVATDAAALDAVRAAIAALADEITTVVHAPPVERLKDGVRVVIAGPPNAGKSTLINLLGEREAAIVSPISGTTRDRIEVHVTRGGVAFVLTDTAGLTETPDPIEAIGVARATDAVAAADILVWMDDVPPPRADAIWVHARADIAGREGLPEGRALALAQSDAASVDRLWLVLHGRAERLLPRIDAMPLRREQQRQCGIALAALQHASPDALIIGEHLREARIALAGVLGIDATETMLDALFGRFCIGK